MSDVLEIICKWGRAFLGSLLMALGRGRYDLNPGASHPAGKTRNFASRSPICRLDVATSLSETVALISHVTFYPFAFVDLWASAREAQMAQKLGKFFAEKVPRRKNWRHWRSRSGPTTESATTHPLKLRLPKYKCVSSIVVSGAGFP